MTGHKSANGAIRSAMNVDIAIGLSAMAPVLWLIGKSDSLTISAAALPVLLYCWTMGSCILLGIRKVRRWELRISAIVFATGVFSSTLILSAATLPPLWAVGMVPVATYFLSRMRVRHYLALELERRLA